MAPRTRADSDGTVDSPRLADPESPIGTRARGPLRSRSARAADAAPWECLRQVVARGAQDLPIVAWESPDGVAIAGIGAAAEITAAGRTRMEVIRDRLSALFAEMSAGDPPPGAARDARPREADPARIAVGGFAFADSDLGARPGRVAARFTIPARLWVRRPGEATVETTWTADGPVGGGGPGPEPLLRPEAFEVEAGSTARPLTRGEWTDAARSALDRIRSGALEKVVLARSREVRSAAPLDPLAIFEALHAGEPECFRFLLVDRAGAAFLGASPERLVRLRDGVVAAEAVAGTIRRDGDAAGDLERSRALLASPKERREHEIVARYLEHALAPGCDEVRAEPEPRAVVLRHMIHLRSAVAARARTATHVLDLVARLHPTPAVAGFPREAALRWIEEWERDPRGWYAGSIGWVDARGEGDFAVGIRSAEIRGSGARLFAGAGIVEGSDPEQEWEETEIKMRPMLDALARS